ncbi:MAG TPA: AzlD domain-containing protein [Candidatus Limnocylindrales bacterium]
MSVAFVPLAVLMALVTYPARALPLLAPGIERLPRPALLYLRLVGPAVLAALAAVNTVLVVDGGRHASLHAGIEWLAVVLALVLAARVRNLFVGLVAAVALTAIARALGLA